MSELSEAAQEELSATTNGTSEQPKRRGRPPGSKNRPKDGTQTPPPTGQVSGFVYVRDEQSVKTNAFMCAIVWEVAAGMFPVRTLTDEEAYKLGEAFDPVLAKWLPILGEWKYEATLLFVILTLVMATRIKRDVKEVGHEEINAGTQE